jgi:AcrR family transcriptional regulator
MTVSLKHRILDTALALAAASSWEALRLYQVAACLGVTLEDIHAHFREKEELVDAWFDRADAALLREGARPEVMALSPRARLKSLLLAWFQALAPHRRVTRQMIAGKFELGHVHYQVAGLLRVSRTVQWWREAAGREAVLPWRALEETGLTTIYLAAFFFWLRDDSENAARTDAWLERLLKRAEPCARWLPAGPARPSVNTGTINPSHSP